MGIYIKLGYKVTNEDGSKRTYSTYLNWNMDVIVCILESIKVNGGTEYYKEFLKDVRNKNCSDTALGALLVVSKLLNSNVVGREAGLPRVFDGAVEVFNKEEFAKDVGAAFRKLYFRAEQVNVNNCKKCDERFRYWVSMKSQDYPELVTNMILHSAWVNRNMREYIIKNAPTDALIDYLSKYNEYVCFDPDYYLDLPDVIKNINKKYRVLKRTHKYIEMLGQLIKFPRYSYLSESGRKLVGGAMIWGSPMPVELLLNFVNNIRQLNKVKEISDRALQKRDALMGVECDITTDNGNVSSYFWNVHNTMDAIVNDINWMKTILTNRDILLMKRVFPEFFNCTYVSSMPQFPEMSYKQLVFGQKYEIGKWDSHKINKMRFFN